MEFFEKIMDFFKGSHTHLYDGKYSRHNQPELDSEEEENNILHFPVSERGVRPFANKDERDVNGDGERLQ